MSDDAIDFERVNMLLGVMKTINESFPHLAPLAAEAGDELKELNDEVRSDRAEKANALALETGVTPGMPADSAVVSKAPLEPEGIRPKAIPSATKSTVADRRI